MTEKKEPISVRIENAITHFLNERYLNTKVQLITLTFDEERQEYTMEYTFCKRRELPKDAVHVTKKRKMYFIDKTVHEVIERPNKPQCTPVDHNLFLENNDIRNAMDMAYTRKEPIDTKKAITIIVIAIIGAVIFYTLTG